MLLTDALMFVGGGSASTAGGIKVTTLAVMFLAIVAEARGDTRRRGLRTAHPARAPCGWPSPCSCSAPRWCSVAPLLLLAISGRTLDRVLFEVDLRVRHLRADHRAQRRAAAVGQVRAHRADVRRPRRHHDAGRRAGAARARQLYPTTRKRGRSLAENPGAAPHPPTTPPCWSSGWAASASAIAEQLVRQGREVLADRTQPGAGAEVVRPAHPRGGGRRHQHRGAAPARRAGVPAPPSSAWAPPSSPRC